MKFLISLLFIISTLSAFENTIEIINGQIKFFNQTNIKNLRCSYTKTPFDTKAHKYCGITLLNFVKKVCKKINKIKFIAYDDYEVSFPKKEINDKTILLIFKSDKKNITPKIIYTDNRYPETHIYKKSIFLIKKVICE